MQNAPKRAKKCAKCAAVARAEKPAKVVPLALVVQKVAAVRKGRTLPRCSRSSTRTTTANSAKTNSWRWPRPFVSACGDPADREVRRVRDPKVAVQVALKETHDSRDAGRQVHRWAHVSKDVVARIAVQKVATSNAAVSMVHHRGEASIASASQVHLKVVGTKVSASSVAPKVVDLNVSVSPAREAVNLNANDLPAHHADAVSTANDSLARLIVHVLNVIVTRVAQNASATNATGLPVLRAAAVWIASASPVRPNVVTGMAPVLHVRRVLRSICG